jgi:hypothetical protein
MSSAAAGTLAVQLGCSRVACGERLKGLGTALEEQAEEVE